MSQATRCGSVAFAYFLPTFRGFSGVIIQAILDGVLRITIKAHKNCQLTVRFGENSAHLVLQSLLNKSAVALWDGHLAVHLDSLCGLMWAWRSSVPHDCDLCFADLSWLVKTKDLEGDGEL